ncbi:hypothetical protein ACLB2K_048405 [Fragaria x ananassa]
MNPLSLPCRLLFRPPLVQARALSLAGLRLQGLHLRPPIRALQSYLASHNHDLIDLINRDYRPTSSTSTPSSSTSPSTCFLNVYDCLWLGNVAGCGEVTTHL